ncbi:AAA family ATPase [Devosia sp. A369]
MNAPMLQHLTVSNFRSIKGEVVAPLDAKMVLLHGENGAGKTSMLSAIELALTGRVMSLQRADPSYEEQLLHRSGLTDSPKEGRVSLTTQGLLENNSFGTILTSSGQQGGHHLSATDASFFSERCYLPQAMLGQLLQIYQDSDSSSESPLSRFVNDLLGLDRLDALEGGLSAVGDLRNFRKTTETFGFTESEKTRIDRELVDLRGTREASVVALASALTELNNARSKIGYLESVDENGLDGVAQQLIFVEDEALLARFHDGQRRLDALMRDLSQRREDVSSKDENELRDRHKTAAASLSKWQSENAARMNSIREVLARLVPDLTAPTSDWPTYFTNAYSIVQSRHAQAQQRARQAGLDSVRRDAIIEEISVARASLTTLDGELGRISKNSSVLAASLAEIAQFITDDVCPVCERNFAETGKASLSEHVGHRIRNLSGAAERLIGLSRSQVDARTRIDRLEQEAAEVNARANGVDEANHWSKLAAELGNLSSELAWSVDVVDEGASLAREEHKSKRELEAFSGLNSFVTQSLVDATEIAKSLNLVISAADHEHSIELLAQLMSTHTSDLVARVEARRMAQDALRRSIAEKTRKTAVETEIRSVSAALQVVENALARAQTVKAQGQIVRGHVEKVRSDIVRRVFNDRLNKLWRDLFVRLTPNEPYIPAFSIPQDSTRRLRPKLVTHHRSGSSGGTPGAMLSAGNLNTAALTLFTALHLTVKPRLPWLILDDPIQSMDDVHVSQFAALLRTLAKDQGRQIFVAVHDRQLFEYLRLELSPAYQGDSLLTLELSRGSSLDTRCIFNRLSYREETALRAA